MHFEPKTACLVIAILHTSLTKLFSHLFFTGHKVRPLGKGILWVCAILPAKAIPEVTYTVSGGMLNPTHSLTHSRSSCLAPAPLICRSHLFGCILISNSMIVCTSLVCGVIRLEQSRSSEVVNSNSESSSSAVNVLRQPRGPDGTKGFSVTR